MIGEHLIHWSNSELKKLIGSNVHLLVSPGIGFNIFRLRKQLFTWHWRSNYGRILKCKRIQAWKRKLSQWFIGSEWH